MKKYTNTFALVSLYGLSLFTIIIVFEHFFRTELPPFSHYLSEYSLGSWGWLHITAFLILSTSQLFLFAALISNVKTSIVSLLSFGIYCIGIFGVTIFPINASGETIILISKIHIFSAIVSSFMVLFYLFSWGFDFKRSRGFEKMATVSFILGTIFCVAFICV